MYNCVRQSFYCHKKVLISSRNSSVKFFSALPVSHGNLNSNYYTNNFILRKVINGKQIQPRHFSLNSITNFFESIRTSEASKFVTNFLIQTHDFTGLSWTTTIIAASLVMKLFISFPCGSYQQYLVAKLELTKIELDIACKALKDAIQRKAIIGQWTQKRLQFEFNKEVRALWTRLVVQNNCHPFKISILFMAQFPFWLLLTLTIRTLAIDSYSNIKVAENPVTALQFRVGGPFWCKDLSLPDPKLILPTINTLSMLAINEIALSSKIQPKVTKGVKAFIVNKLLPNFMRVFAILFFFISAASPAAVSLFWTSSSLISLGQNLLLLSPKTRRFLKVPKTASEVDKPYSYIFNKTVEKVSKLFFWKK